MIIGIDYDGTITADPEMWWAPLPDWMECQGWRRA